MTRIPPSLPPSSWSDYNLVDDKLYEVSRPTVLFSLHYRLPPSQCCRFQSMYTKLSDNSGHKVGRQRKSTTTEVTSWDRLVGIVCDEGRFSCSGSLHVTPVLALGGHSVELGQLEHLLLGSLLVLLATLSQEIVTIMII